jgi:hypothetical protein
MPPPPPLHAELCRWLVAGGASLDRVAVVADPRAGRGIVAAAPIAAGEAVLRVPRALVITADLVRGTPIGRVVAGIPDHTPALLLAAWLLVQRAAVASPQRAYLASLPEAFPTDALFFSAAEEALLEGSYILPQLRARRAALHREHAALRARVPAFAGLGFGEFFWARFSVTTRVFGLTIDGRPTTALVPFADMLNHHRPAPTRWTWDAEADGFVLLATAPIPAGAPVSTSYGAKSNGRLLVSYGFAVPDNDADEALVALAIPPGAAGFARKSALLGGVARDFEVRGRLDTPSGRAMLSFLRVAVASPGEMERLGPPGRVDPAAVAPLGPRNEAAALGALAAACAVALRRFPTTGAADDVLLGDEALPVNARHAVLVRRGEKRILAAHGDLAARAGPLLRLPRHSLARAVREQAAGDGEVARCLSAYAAGIGARRRAEAAAFTRSPATD